MAWGHDPYQEDFQIADFWGSHIGAGLRVLLLLGGMGEGPLKGLEGLMGGTEGKEDTEGDGAKPPQVIQGQGQPPPQIQQPPPMGGMPPSGPPPMGGQMGGMGGQVNPEMLQRIMEMLRMFGGQGGPGMMGGGMGMGGM